MNNAERKYSECERETLVLIFSLKKFRLYLLSSDPFQVITDKKALKSLFLKKDINGLLEGWLELLTEYEFQFQYRKGSKNKEAGLF